MDARVIPCMQRQRIKHSEISTRTRSAINQLQVVTTCQHLLLNMVAVAHGCKHSLHGCPGLTTEMVRSNQQVKPEETLQPITACLGPRNLVTWRQLWEGNVNFTESLCDNQARHTAPPSLHARLYMVYRQNIPEMIYTAAFNTLDLRNRLDSFKSGHALYFPSKNEESGSVTDTLSTRNLTPRKKPKSTPANIWLSSNLQKPISGIARNPFNKISVASSRRTSGSMMALKPKSALHAKWKGRSSFTPSASSWRYIRGPPNLNSTQKFSTCRNWSPAQYISTYGFLTHCLSSAGKVVFNQLAFSTWPPVKKEFLARGLLFGLWVECSCKYKREFLYRHINIIYWI